ncbi:hypothetical protein FACS1894123_09390 [Bacteroidia bacterium]|nr:hypothetical protein FACS1894123_09390 [Bacteroidia bacterium]
MKQIAGITIERNAHEKANFARIDLRKYGEQLMPFFKEIGVSTEESLYDPEFVAKIRRAEKGQIVASCKTKEELHAYLESLPYNKKTKDALKEAHTKKLKTYKNPDELLAILYVLPSY